MCDSPTSLPVASSTDRVTDAELVARAREGDRAAFGELVERHQQAVVRAARAALESAEEAEDVAQEAFVTAFRKLGGFRGDASFRTWILAIAFNLARTRRRKARRWLQRFHAANEAPVSDVATAAGSQEAALIRSDLKRQAHRVIRALPPKYRDVLLLAASGRYSVEEMAAMLGVPAGTVKWRANEARRLARARLERLGVSRG